LPSVVSRWAGGLRRRLHLDLGVAVDLGDFFGAP
jgi:hypothetical protein